MSLSDIFADAKERVERGWNKLAWGENGVNYNEKDNGEGCICVGLAIDYAGATREGVEALLLFAEVAGIPVPDPADSLRPVAEWNDHRDRTKQEVLDALDQAYAVALAREAAS